MTSAPANFDFMCSPPLFSTSSHRPGVGLVLSPIPARTTALLSGAGRRRLAAPVATLLSRSCDCQKYNPIDGVNGKHADRSRRLAATAPQRRAGDRDAPLRGLFSFLSGGYILTRSAPIAIVFLLLAAVWVWFLRRRAWPPPLLLAALVAMAAFTGWVGLSTLWSIGPDLSWVAFDLAAFYLAVLAVVGLTPIRRLQLRLAGWGFVAVASRRGRVCLPG